MIFHVSWLQKEDNTSFDKHKYMQKNYLFWVHLQYGNHFSGPGEIWVHMQVYNLLKAYILLHSSKSTSQLLAPAPGNWSKPSVSGAAVMLFEQLFFFNVQLLTFLNLN